MGTPAMMPPPPAPGDDSQQGAVPPTSAQPASPAPPVDGGPAKQAAMSVFQIVQNARALAKQFPQVAPEIRQVGDLMQQVQMKIAQGASSGEPAAPPVG